MPHGHYGRLTINILVTGNQGYIGSILVPDLLRAGYCNVTGLDTDLFRDSILYNTPLDIRQIEKDIRDITKDDVAGFDTIIHLAGISNDPLGDLQPGLTYEINLEATVRLAKFAKSVGVKRFIFSSTCSVYGASLDVELTEESRANPVTTYARSKYLAEQELSLLANEDFCPVYLRSATAYGLSPKLRFDLVVNNLVSWACSTGNIYMKSDGTAWRPLVHVKDISSAIIGILTAPVSSINNQIFNVGSTDNNYQIVEIANRIKSIITGTEIVYADDAEKDTRNYNVSFKKLHETLPGYSCRYSLDNAIIELYRYFRNTGLQEIDFEGPVFSRIKCIKSLQARNIIDSQLRWNDSAIKLAI